MDKVIPHSEFKIFQHPKKLYNRVIYNMTICYIFISRDMDTLQAGIGRNLGNIVSWIATFLVSLLVSFLGSTTLTLVVLSPVPIIVISSLVLNTVNHKFF